jgi:hypothetical protein
MVVRDDKRGWREQIRKRSQTKSRQGDRWRFETAGWTASG